MDRTDDIRAEDAPTTHPASSGGDGSSLAVDVDVVLLLERARHVARAPSPRRSERAAAPSPPLPPLPTSPRIAPLTMQRVLQERFWCRAKLRLVALGKCLDDYVAHTTYGLSTSNCTECTQGKQNRRVFADS